MTDYQEWLDAAIISDEVAALRPDYRCVLIVAEGLQGGPSDEVSEKMLTAAEEEARSALGGNPPEELGHMKSWREAFRAFGAKPQRTRNSAEALLRRVDEGLPRINRLADAYNAVSIRLAVPLGGENLAAYQGPLRLVRATGDEDFAIMSSGEPAVEHPAAGEVVWRDDLGATCRRWNWRQCYRTRLTEDTADAVFICDVLDVEPGDSDARAQEVLAAMTDALMAVSPGVRLTSQVLGA